jgi:hypothetical protein
MQTLRKLPTTVPTAKMKPPMRIKIGPMFSTPIHSFAKK